MAKKKKDPNSINKNLKLKLYPTQAQIKDFERDRQNAKFVWNICLAQRKQAYDSKRNMSNIGHKFSEDFENPSEYSQSAELTELKKLFPIFVGKNKDVKIDLNTTPATVLTGVLSSLQASYNLFFSNLKKNPKAAGLPQFKKKHSNISLKYKPFKPEHFIVNDKNIRIKFPIIGWVKARGKWDLEGGKVKTAAVTQECGEYFATLSVEVPQKKIIHPNKDQIVGIDMGVITTATLSDDTSFKLPDSVKDLDKRVRALQRRMRNKKKHSKNSKKAYAKIAKVQKRIARQKQSFLHEQSTRIAKQYGGIIVEDLKIQNMTKSAKGTKEKPGKNVAQKKGLNREILRNSLGDLRVKLEQKTKKFGGVFVKIDPKYTSQKCSKCGKQDKENRQTQASFVCMACGFSANADFNAALNIKEAGKFILKP